jgi:hypothetical protein
VNWNYSANWLWLCLESKNGIISQPALVEWKSHKSTMENFPLCHQRDCVMCRAFLFISQSCFVDMNTNINGFVFYCFCIVNHSMTNFLTLSNNWIETLELYPFFESSAMWGRTIWIFLWLFHILQSYRGFWDKTKR